MKINPRQITFAREYRGMSQTELAAKVSGLSQSNLSKFEKGIGTLSDKVIERVMEVLGFPSGFFSLSISNRVENAHYRRKSGLSKSVKADIEYSDKIIGYLIDRMGESVFYPESRVPSIDLEDGYTPEMVADYMRKLLGLKEDPVNDIMSILENFGIKIVEEDYDVDVFDGVSFNTDDGTNVIVLNRNFSNDHKRFTLAHELGHLVMHLSPIVPEYRNKEDEANRFASEFLMPSELIRNSLFGLKPAYLKNLKGHWLTSMSSIIRRAKDLGCIDFEKYRYFNIELSRKGYKKKEPFDVTIDKPVLFMQAYERHRVDLNYSEEELATAFNLPLDVITRFFLKPPRMKLRVSPIMD